jgi:hypothetical protein
MDIYAFHSKYAEYLKGYYEDFDRRWRYKIFFDDFVETLEASLDTPSRINDVVWNGMHKAYPSVPRAYYRQVFLYGWEYSIATRSLKDYIKNLLATQGPPKSLEDWM